MMLVKIRFKPLDLLSHMADMRVWLDRNGVDAAGFSYREQNNRAIARLAFMARTEAEAFAARFAGRIIIDMAPSPAQIAPPPRAPPWTAATPPERLSAGAARNALLAQQEGEIACRPAAHALSSFRG
jgi:hypothetical protein